MHSPTQEFMLSLLAFLKQLEGHYDIRVMEVKGKSLVDAQNEIASAFVSSTYDFLLLGFRHHRALDTGSRSDSRWCTTCTPGGSTAILRYYGWFPSRPSDLAHGPFGCGKNAVGNVPAVG